MSKEVAGQEHSAQFSWTFGPKPAFVERVRAEKVETKTSSTLIFVQFEEFGRCCIVKYVLTESEGHTGKSQTKALGKGELTYQNTRYMGYKHNGGYSTKKAKRDRG